MVMYGSLPIAKTHKTTPGKISKMNSNQRLVALSLVSKKMRDENDMKVRYKYWVYLEGLFYEYKDMPKLAVDENGNFDVPEIPTRESNLNGGQEVY